jgi:IS5 family transposase
MSTLSHPKQIVETFSIFDDLIAHIQLNKRMSGRKPSLSLAEIATISLIRSEYSIRTWKATYKLLEDKYSDDFMLPDYKNFVLLMNNKAKVLIVLVNILLQINQRKSGIIKLIDSTSLPVCKNIRIGRHKTMRKVATRSKTSMGWFYGLKLHTACDLEGNILHIRFTTGNVNDRVVLDQFLEKLRDSIIIADAGYCSKKLEQKAARNNNVLITCLRKNMKKIATYLDICLLNLRSRVEVLFSILKERLGLETSLPRSVNGYLAHYIHVIFGYMVRKAIS